MTAVKRLTFLLMTASLGMGSMAFAALQPPWQGEPRTTFQEWDFATNSVTPSPNSVTVNNPYGDPLLRVTPADEWVSTVDGRQGVWPLSGEIDVYLPNWQELQPKKEIWIQLTWKATDVDLYLPNEPLIGVAPFESMQMSREDSAEQDGWVSSLFIIDIWPNPSEEWISVKGDIMVDELLIDTYCVPEPVTILLLGAGGTLVTLARKRYFFNGCSRERDESKWSHRSKR
jgi:hypothetical protein